MAIYDEKNKISYTTLDTSDIALISKTNGNIIIDGPDLSAVLKQAYGQKAFWKLYMADYIQVVLGAMDYKQLDVFMYISMNTRPSDNIFFGTQETIAEAVGCSRLTVARLLKKLIQHEYIKRKQTGVYMVNPNIVMKGGIAKKNLLIQYWDSEQLNVPLPKMKYAGKAKTEAELELEGQGKLPLLESGETNE